MRHTLEIGALPLSLTTYEMWYSRLHVVKHFRIFGSQCYALIPKHQRNKFSERKIKCIFSGYYMTSKAYQLYDEENKKFILSRDVIFLETDKDFPTVDRRLNQIEKFVPQKFYYESDNILPHLEGGIPILDQSVDFPSLNDEKLVVVDDDNSIVADVELVNASVSTETITEMEIT